MDTSNIIMLATDKPSRLYYHRFDKQYILGESEGNNSSVWVNEILYKVSDEPIKPGDWKYCSFTNEVTKYDKNAKEAGTGKCEDCKKIIATTNKYLGLPVLSDSFVKDFIKNLNTERLK